MTHLLCDIFKDNSVQRVKTYRVSTIIEPENTATSKTRFLAKVAYSTRQADTHIHKENKVMHW